MTRVVLLFFSWLAPSVSIHRLISLSNEGISCVLQEKKREEKDEEVSLARVIKALPSTSQQ